MALSKENKPKKTKKNMFSQRAKYAHYKAIAKGASGVKKDSKYSEKEQRAYARGQVAAREECYRVAKNKTAKGTYSVTGKRGIMSKKKSRLTDAERAAYWIGVGMSAGNYDGIRCYFDSDNKRFAKFCKYGYLADVNKDIAGRLFESSSPAPDKSDIDYIAAKRYCENLAKKYDISDENLQSNINRTYRKAKHYENFREELRCSTIEGYAEAKNAIE